LHAATIGCPPEPPEPVLELVLVVVVVVVVVVELPPEPPDPLVSAIGRRSQAKAVTAARSAIETKPRMA
jgi:hypothetical protein